MTGKEKIDTEQEEKLSFKGFIIGWGIAIAVVTTIVAFLLLQPVDEEKILGEVITKYSYLEALLGEEKVGYVLLEKQLNAVEGKVYYNYTEGDIEGFRDYLSACSPSGTWGNGDCILKGTDGKLYSIYKGGEFILDLTRSKRIIAIDKDAKKLYIPKDSLIESKVALEVEDSKAKETKLTDEEKYHHAVVLLNDLGYYTITKPSDLVNEDEEVEVSEEIIENRIEGKVEEGKEKGYAVDEINQESLTRVLNNNILGIDLREGTLGINYRFTKETTVEAYERIQTVLEKYVKSMYGLTDKELREIYRVGEKGSYKGVRYGELLPSVALPVGYSYMSMYELEADIKEYRNERNKIEKETIQM